MIEVECPAGHVHEYESAVVVPLGCPDCGAPLSPVADPSNPEKTQSDKV